MAYFAATVSYGFDWSATRESIDRDKAGVVSRVATNVWAKALLCIVGFLVLLGAIRAVPRVHEVSSLLIILFGSVLGGVLFPTWLFQGLERMGPISAINLSVRALVVVGTFAFVRRPQDFVVDAGLSSAGAIVAGFAGVWIAFRALGLRLVRPSWDGIWASLREGWVLFLSSAAIVLYTSGNAFILGLVAGDTVVGYYSAAEKIVRAVVNLLDPLSQALFPRFSRLAEESRVRALQWGKRLLLAMGGTGLLVSIGTFVWAGLIVKLVLGPAYEPSVSVLRILAMLPFLIVVSNVLGVQLMIPFGREKAVFILVLMAGCLNMALATLLAPVWKADGMALSVLVAELSSRLPPLLICGGPDSTHCGARGNPRGRSPMAYAKATLVDKTTQLCAGTNCESRGARSRVSASRLVQGQIWISTSASRNGLGGLRDPDRLHAG